MPREEVVKWRLQEGKEGCVPSQSDRRENTGVLEDIRFMSDQIMYDTLSEGKRNNNNLYQVYNYLPTFAYRADYPFYFLLPRVAVLSGFP